MSTLPHDSADAQQRTPVMPTAVHDLDGVAGEFEIAAKSLGVQRPSTTELHGLCRQVAAFTTDLFPGKLIVKIGNDPEVTDDLYFVFEVGATGGINDIAARHDEWHGRVCQLPITLPGLFRLSIAVR